MFNEVMNFQIPLFGTIVNTIAIIFGGILGLLFKKNLKERMLISLRMACGVSVLFIGIAGVLEKMLNVQDGKIVASGSMFIVICMALGTLIGEIINIEGYLEKFAKWLKIKSGNAKDEKFVDAFISTSLIVSIGAMAVIGPINDGIMGDHTVLFIKSLLDIITVMVMTASLGAGAIFSAIPVFVCEALVTLLAVLIKPYITDQMLDNLTMVGSVLIFTVGINLVWDKKIKVANMLPALIIAIIATLLKV